uniref:Protein FAM32A-like n=1 Tax=Araucaria cunninghamii TaxID=56994 RepID=A0A0D6R7W0_ARACU
MSAFENVVGGKLKLKGKALDVKAGGMKKKKKQKKHYEDDLTLLKMVKSTGDANDSGSEPQMIGEAENGGSEAQQPVYEDHRTPAEKRYDEQRQQLDVKRLAKLANKSHRDRIEDFNQYLANLSEHYDIPKVGPG